MSAAAATVVEFDPTRDLRYREARLARDVVDWLAWLDTSGTAPRTLDQYERDLSRLCLLYPSKTLPEITDSELLHLARRFKPGERRVRMAAVRSFFKWAKGTRRITDNPCDYLPDIKRTPQRTIDTFDDAEVEALVALPLRESALMLVLLDAGLRKSEARALQVGHYRPEPAPGALVVLSGKGGKGRLVPMTPRLSRAYAELTLVEGLAHTDRLWYDRPGGGQNIRRTTTVGEATFHRWWVRCLSEAGVRYRNPHTARHTFATRYLRAGGALERLSLVMGHESIRTTFDLYAHLDTRDVVADMALLGGEG